MISVLKSKISLLKMLFARDFKSIYIHNMLGIAWLIITPLFTVLLYSFVFSVILKARSEGYNEQYSYSVFLLAGMIPYLAISDVIQSSSVCLQNKKDLMIKTIFPAELLPINTVLISIVSEIITLLIILSLAIYEGEGQIPWIWTALPLMVLIRLLFSLSIAWWISIISVFIPDIKQVINALLPAWMFLTPILYSKQQAPEYFQNLQYLNPLNYIVEGYRSIILEASWPETNLWIVFAFLIILNILGYYFFKALLPRAKDFL